MPTPSLWSELFGFGLAISFSPLHIGMLLLILLGPSPLRRGSWFVLGWLLTSAAAIALLLSVGHGLLSSRQGGGPPGWTRRLDGFCALPLPLLLGLSAAVQVSSPDDLFLYARTAASLLEAGLSRPRELLTTAVFSLFSGTLLLLPLAGLVLVGQERLLPVLQAGKLWLFDNAELIVAAICFGLAAYLGWQGIEGLRAG